MSVPKKVVLLAKELTAPGAYIEENRANLCPIVTLVRPNGERVKSAWAETKSWLSSNGLIDYEVFPDDLVIWRLSSAGRVWTTWLESKP